MLAGLHSQYGIPRGLVQYACAQLWRVLAETFDDFGRICGPLPLACDGNGGIDPTQPVEDCRVLCECDDQDGRRDGFAFDPIRCAFAIPTLVQLAKRIDDVVTETESLGQALRDFTMCCETGFDFW